MAETLFRFNGTNPAAQRAAERMAASMIADITEEVAATIRSLIVRAIKEGIPVYDAARLIEALIGLDERRAQAAMNYREALINEGLSFDRVNTLTDRYSKKLLRQRANTIARTEIMEALNAGAEESWRQAQKDGLLGPGAKKEWITTPDERLCPLCAPMDAVQVHLAAPFMTPVGPADRPPLHPNCLPGDALVAACGRVTAKSERRYDGDLLVVHTAGGKDLACSPNHPILTPRGWAPAHALHVGGHVISSPLGQWESGRRDVDHENVPSRFQEMAEACRRSEEMATTPVPLAPEDFHGDGTGSQVAIVWTNRLLLDRRNPASRKPFREESLGGRGMQAESLPRYGARNLRLQRVGLAASCAMCGRNLTRPLGGGHAGPLQPFGFALAARLHLPLAEASVDESARDAQLARELIHGSAGIVAPDKVIAVDRLSFHGFLHNMETTRHAYWANGILTHNCRCAVVPVP